VFLSLDIFSARISMFLGSIATHNQMESDEPTLLLSRQLLIQILFFCEDIL
jgi:hypothetical protein